MLCVTHSYMQWDRKGNTKEIMDLFENIHLFLLLVA